ncbi:MAG TPA: nucleoside diphosphate kinase regulator [Clostridia bacterium]|nr:nucleoside diphosphate kinase regulator [Clostridia bacterium]
MISTMKRTIYITKADMTRLRSLITDTKTTRDDLASLRDELDLAQVVEPGEIPADVITMNTKARLRDLEDGEEMTFTLVFPENASYEDRRISVLAPIGTAMLGQREGEEFEWEVPAGRIRLKVLKVIYQPEAAKHYHL